MSLNKDNPEVLAYQYEQEHKDATLSQAWLEGYFFAIKPRNKHVQINTNDVPETLKPIINKWLEDRKDRKRKPYTQKGFEAFVKRLIKLSNGNIQIADAIVEQSIGNGYQGIFKISNGELNNIRQTNATPNIYSVAETILNRG